jgi:hypothetical protein
MWMTGLKPLPKEGLNKSFKRSSATCKTQIPFGNDKQETQIPFGNDKQETQIPFGNDKQETQIPL